MNQNNVKTISVCGDHIDLRMDIGLQSERDCIGQEVPSLKISLTNLHPTRDWPENFGVLTPNLGANSVKDTFFVDTFNFPFYEQLLTEDIAVPTGFSTRRGFGTYPLYKFTPAFIEQLKAADGAFAANYAAYEAVIDNYKHPDMPEGFFID